jgi:hypothetical protein
VVRDGCWNGVQQRQLCAPAQLTGSSWALPESLLGLAVMVMGGGGVMGAALGAPYWAPLAVGCSHG